MSANHTRDRTDCITSRDLVFAVFAPFGTDATLSNYPDGKPKDAAGHPLTQNLLAVAATGVHVVALVDLFDQDTFLVDIPAGRPEAISVVSQGKQSMDTPQALAGLAARAAQVRPGAKVVLALEGHGAGYLPDIDRRLLNPDSISANGELAWRLTPAEETVVTMPYDTEGEPFLKQGSPVLPGSSPTCPTNHLALSTWAMGDALAQAEAEGCPKVSVLHLNNCFNMSVELLHTLAPYAEVATGYCNYNFFSAGEAYPLVFRHLAQAGEASAETLAKWFAAANHAVLEKAGHEPTVAGTVALARMHDIVEKVDDLSDALLAALRTVSDAERPALVDKIQKAIVEAQQYDSRPDYELETPDELTDLDSFAASLLNYDFSPYKVAPAADALRSALSGIKQYGDVDSPWMAPGQVWNFSSPNLAMNIFLPDPLRKGLWDWRSQYYLDVNPDPGKPQVQRHIIDFVKVTDWVDFLVEYHKDTPFNGLLPALIPDFPIKGAQVDPRCPRRGQR